MQHTSHLLMIQPVHFSFNDETAVNNSFQNKSDQSNVQTKAREEFEQFITVLRAHDIDVTVVEDSPNPHTPDSIFPNNWISFHDDGSICLYPMFAVNRRLERKPSVLTAIQQKFVITHTNDFTRHENDSLFLEGTGSMVLDRENKIAYACLSPRTNQSVLDEFCNTMHYKGVSFIAVDAAGDPIYHTNVMMCLGDTFTVICADCIDDKKERKMVLDSLRGDDKEIILITEDQVNNFAGNMLEVKGKDGKRFLIMSESAFKSLTKKQIAQLEAHVEIIHSSLDTIEACGGGSARCMMAEIFLPKE
jgi:hypothetical protein